MYPHFDTLGVEPDYLWIGACAIRALGATIPLQRTPEEQRRHDSAVRNAWGRRQHVRGNGVRTYASQYVGVAKIKGRWVGMWGPGGGRQGPRRPAYA